MSNLSSTPKELGHCSTIEAARILGMAVRSIQLMVDRGDLHAWKTPGGHRRISMQSVENWIKQKQTGDSHPNTKLSLVINTSVTHTNQTILIIDPSIESRNQLAKFFDLEFSDLKVHFTSDPILGLTLMHQIKPSVVLFCLPIPSINITSLISLLRSKPDFLAYRLIAVESLQSEKSKSGELEAIGIKTLRRSDLYNDLLQILNEEEI